MKKKKLHYLPGIISILGLPVLLFFWGPSDPVQQNTISINLTTAPVNEGPLTQTTTKTILYAAVKNKKIIAVNMNDFIWNDRSAYLFNQKFNFISHEIESMQFTNDTASVLKISFGAMNNYSSLIWVLNQAMFYDLKKYALIDNELYLFASVPAIPAYATIAMDAQTWLAPGIKPPSKWEIFKRNLDYKTTLLGYRFNYLFYRQQQNKLLAAGFLLLIVLPAIIKIRQFLRHNTKPVAFHDFSAAD